MKDAELLGTVELETGPDPVGSVLWLHGLGADGHDFEGVVPMLGLDERTPLRFVFPHAPIMPITINAGMQMRGWYDVVSLDLPRQEDEPGVRRSAGLIEALLVRERERFPAERIVLAGFSQGGALALHVGLRHPERLAGLMVLSAYLLLKPTLEDESSAANRATPIFQAHGDFNPLVPTRLGHETMEHLLERGYAVQWSTYPVEHGVHPREIQDAGRWLVERFLDEPRGAAFP